MSLIQACGVEHKVDPVLHDGSIVGRREGLADDSNQGKVEFGRDL